VSGDLLIHTNIFILNFLQSKNKQLSQFIFNSDVFNCFIGKLTMNNKIVLVLAQ